VVSVVFTPGSATLPPSATLNLRRFALAHKGVPITITGHGEAVLHSPEAQSGALDLALRRAAAIAVPLAAAGVSAANLRLHAEAAGQGATASL
jgi:outer membrane protein OmpA-like peptidoglycan-associated protein